MKNLIIFSLSMLGLLLRTYQSYSQVSLAPTSICIHEASNTAEMYIANHTDYDQEVTIAFEFGYPGSDELGNPVTINDDSLATSAYNLSSNLRAFPRSFILIPGQQQTVRFQVKPLSNKPDGVYWSRVIVSSARKSVDADTTILSDGIGTQINFIFHQNIAAFYHKGKVNTGLQVLGVSTKIENNGLVAVSELHPMGNSPFIGSVHATLYNAQGKIVGENHQTCTAYFDVKRTIEIPFVRERVFPGNYTLELTYESKRSDILSQDLAQMAPVMYRSILELE